MEGWGGGYWKVLLKTLRMTSNKDTGELIPISKQNVTGIVHFETYISPLNGHAANLPASSDIQGPL